MLKRDFAMGTVGEILETERFRIYSIDVAEVVRLAVQYDGIRKYPELADGSVLFSYGKRNFRVSVMKDSRDELFPKRVWT